MKSTGKMKWLILLLLAIPTLSAAGCSGGKSGIAAEPGDEFALSVGQSVYIRGEDFEIRFIEVIADSRCPRGATCVWAGEVSCLIEITRSGEVTSKILVKPGSDGNSETSFNDYIIAFDIMPYPAAGKEIKQQDYRLIMIISKKPMI